MDCETLATVAAPFETPIRTPLASQLTKEIFIERFQKEIVSRFQFSLSSQLRVDDTLSLQDVKSRRTVLKQRIHQCVHTRVRSRRSASDRVRC
jgi:hypothetical protein